MRQAIGLVLNICFAPAIVAGLCWEMFSAAFAYGQQKAHAVAEWLEGGS